MKKNERLDALNILINLFKDKQSLALISKNENLSPFSKELCYGLCRHYYSLTAIADLFIKKRPKEVELWLLLLLGLYQLYYLKKPHFAAVKETVDLLNPIKKSWAKGLVNGVLRTYCREEATIASRLKDNKVFLYNHPEWLIAQIQKDWPKDWQAILKANDTHPPMSLRINQQKTEREDYFKRLEKAEIMASLHDYSPWGLRLAKAVDVYSLPGFKEGDVSVQDESAQLAVTFLALQKGQRILDACAAPGGKTCHILEKESQLEACVAIDVDERRLRRVKENLERLNLQANLIAGDALKPDNWWDGKLFDRILLDAPCSATGVIRRHPDIKLLRTIEEVEKIVLLQQGLLQSLWPLLKKDGLFLYATCSILKQENELQIKEFINNNQDCELITLDEEWGVDTGYGLQIFPKDEKGDGFFYSLLRKV